MTATRLAIATDNVLDYYLHTSGGAVTVSGGGFGEQTIQSVSIPSSDQAYFNAMVQRVDNIGLATRSGDGWRLGAIRELSRG